MPRKKNNAVVERSPSSYYPVRGSSVVLIGPARLQFDDEEPYSDQFKVLDRDRVQHFDRQWSMQLQHQRRLLKSVRPVQFSLVELKVPYTTLSRTWKSNKFQHP
jgi:hypothetical protein